LPTTNTLLYILLAMRKSVFAGIMVCLWLAAARIMYPSFALRYQRRL